MESTSPTLITKFFNSVVLNLLKLMQIFYNDRFAFFIVGYANPLQIRIKFVSNLPIFKFDVNDVVLVFLLLALNICMSHFFSIVSTVYFEQVNISWIF